MFVWKVKFASGEVSTMVSDVYIVLSETLAGALKKAKRLDGEALKDAVDSGLEPEASLPIGVEIVCRLDD